MKEKIYLLPGFMCDSRLWNKLSPCLDEYELIYLCIPHTSDFNEITKELANTIQEDNINLFGFSFGAYIASYFAINYPKKVKKLFLASGTAGVMMKDEITKRENAIKLINRFGFKGLSRKQVVSLLEKSNQEDEKLIKTIQDMYTDLGKDIYMYQIGTIYSRIALEKKLLKLNIPVTFFYSTKDKLLNYNSLEKFTKEDKHIRKISREGTSHMTPLELPEVLSDEIRRWMIN